MDVDVTIKKPDNSIALAAWITGICGVSVLGRVILRGETFFILLVLSIIWPLLFFVISENRFIPRLASKSLLFGIYGFFLFALPSVFLSKSFIVSAGYLLLTFLTICICLQFNSTLTPLQIQRALSIYSYFGALVLVSFTIIAYVPGKRLGLGTDWLNPNAIGLISVSVILSSLLNKNFFLRILTLVPSLMVLFLTDSRSAVLGTTLSFILLAVLALRKLTFYKKIIILIIITFIVLFIAIFWEQIWSHVANYLALKDPYRGIKSHFTGRMYAWKAAWKLFLSSPWFGVGFRTHELLLKIASSAHNGYIGLLAEIGLPGFLFGVYLTISGVVYQMNLIRYNLYVNVAKTFLALSVAYLFIAFFERYLINVGNPTSVLFLLAITYRTPSFLTTDPSELC